MQYLIGLFFLAAQYYLMYRGWKYSYPDGKGWIISSLSCGVISQALIWGDINDPITFVIVGVAVIVAILIIILFIYLFVKYI